MKLCKHQDLRLDNFQKIKRFLLQYGDRKTYCNRYNNNPHYVFPHVEVFLNPGPIDRGVDDRCDCCCDPARTDFNTLVIRTKEFVYYHISYDHIHDGVLVRISNRREGDDQDQTLSLFLEILKHAEERPGLREARNETAQT